MKVYVIDYGVPDHNKEMQYFKRVYENKVEFITNVYRTITTYVLDKTSAVNLNKQVELKDGKVDFYIKDLHISTTEIYLNRKETKIYKFIKSLRELYLFRHGQYSYYASFIKTNFVLIRTDILPDTLFKPEEKATMYNNYEEAKATFEKIIIQTSLSDFQQNMLLGKKDVTAIIESGATEMETHRHHALVNNSVIRQLYWNWSRAIETYIIPVSLLSLPFQFMEKDDNMNVALAKFGDTTKIICTYIIKSKMWFFARPLPNSFKRFEDNAV